MSDDEALESPYSVPEPGPEAEPGSTAQTIRMEAIREDALADAGERFDVVLAMEVVEHVADVSLFMRRCAEMVKPGGLMIAATINRTAKSFALAIVGAEYVLRWLPRGTHDYRKFRRPSELARDVRAAKLSIGDITGLGYDPWRDRWQQTSDLGVNYLLFATSPK